ncbi:3-hydroxyacyl-CoA dehydrogenase family protein [Rhodopirellula sp. MGV]|uniref:3-hydroxyacyl-CoA dehydrogenase family protein n=1 Tax=Rhodopirellula sp. MGV TaxID=2023130 RepID=UPI000B96FCC0|nr:3-hydroxyacyl-CoA dehydrogenase family protein [Rhodopirellula sp. MGV]OYP36584.1 hypothetical protein CGZ80_08115 [Rhodopirellula sp. MGV]PNY34561.1 3-hydroxyacyl-CoA dehydrogenase family protein [Rhodopirellula baltica]
MQPTNWPDHYPKTILIGSGVVGIAIADAHASAKQAFCLCDQNESAILNARRGFEAFDVIIETIQPPLPQMHGISVIPKEPPPLADDSQSCDVLLVIESIVEQLAAKQQLFADLASALGAEAILCSNTSTLRIDAIAQGNGFNAEQLCGLHFFMPVHLRPAVEVVSGTDSDAAVVDLAVDHAAKLHKRAIRCKDGPGFIVNRMLSPYLNQALLLLCRGATADQIERVAFAYGMPISPLELIDWIGATTMFHAGRAYLNAFPSRMNPSPIVPALVKQKLLGRTAEQGLFDYRRGERSSDLGEAAKALVETYRIANKSWSDGDVLRLLAIPMWIEANQILKEGLVESMDVIDAAMVGGLGFNSHEGWSTIFDEIGREDIERSMTLYSDEFACMRPMPGGK